VVFFYWQEVHFEKVSLKKVSLKKVSFKKYPLKCFFFKTFFKNSESGDDLIFMIREVKRVWASIEPTGKH